MNRREWLRRVCAGAAAAMAALVPGMPAPLPAPSAALFTVMDYDDLIRKTLEDLGKPTFRDVVAQLKGMRSDAYRRSCE